MKKLALFILTILSNLSLFSMDKKAFVKAVESSNFHALEEYLKNGGDINAGVYLNDEKTRKGSALHLAIKNKSKPLVEFLLKNGIDINQCDSIGETALSMAIQKPDLEMIKVLFGHKDIDVNKKGAFGLPILHALHYCHIYPRKSNLEIIELFLKKLNVNQKDLDGKNFLHNICEDDLLDYIDFEKVIALLKAHNFDFYCEDNKGNNPLFIALKKNRSWFKSSIKYFDLNYKNKNGETFLHQINGYTGLSLIKYLIKNIKNIDEKNNNGDTILNILVKKYEIEMTYTKINIHETHPNAQGLLRPIKLLISYGADIEEIKDNVNVYKIAVQFKYKIFEAIKNKNFADLAELGKKGYSFNFANDKGVAAVDLVADMKNMESDVDAEEEAISQLFGLLILNDTKLTKDTIPLLLSNGHRNIVEKLISWPNNSKPESVTQPESKIFNNNLEETEYERELKKTLENKETPKHAPQKIIDKNSNNSSDSYTKKAILGVTVGSLVAGGITYLSNKNFRNKLNDKFNDLIIKPAKKIKEKISKHRKFTAAALAATVVASYCLYKYKKA